MHLKHSFKYIFAACQRYLEQNCKVTTHQLHQLFISGSGTPYHGGLDPKVSVENFKSASTIMVTQSFSFSPKPGHLSRVTTRDWFSKECSSCRTCICFLLPAVLLLLNVFFCENQKLVSLHYGYKKKCIGLSPGWQNWPCFLFVGSSLHSLQWQTTKASVYSFGS